MCSDAHSEAKAHSAHSAPSEDMHEVPLRFLPLRRRKMHWQCKRKHVLYK
jgi:hypothetical protein